MEVLLVIHKAQQCLKREFTREEFISGTIGQLEEPRDFTPEPSVSCKHIITYHWLLSRKVQVSNPYDQGFSSKTNFRALTKDSRAPSSTTKICLI